MKINSKLKVKLFIFFVIKHLRNHRKWSKNILSLLQHINVCLLITITTYSFHCFENDTKSFIV